MTELPFLFSEVRSLVKVELAVLGSPSLMPYGFCGRKATLNWNTTPPPFLGRWGGVGWGVILYMKCILQSATTALPCFHLCHNWLHHIETDLAPSASFPSVLERTVGN